MHPYTLEDLLDTYSSYPKRIQSAILRARTHPTITSSLTRASLAVLTALITRVSCRDGMSALKARIDRLAAEAAVSTKTVQRAITALRELGWLALPTDGGRNELGKFSYRHYQFTAHLCRLLELPCAGEPLGDDADAEATKMSDGGVYVDLTYKRDQHEISIQKNKGTPVDLPAALQDACSEFQVNPTGMAKLRGIAHSAGHDLSAIITVARDYLKKTGATGHRAYRYLETMARKAVDYLSRARQTDRLRLANQQAKEIRDIEAECRHRQFVGPAGLKVKIFDGIAEVNDNGQIRTVVGSDLTALYAAVRAGKLVHAETNNVTAPTCMPTARIKTMKTPGATPVAHSPEATLTNPHEKISVLKRMLRRGWQATQLAGEIPTLAATSA